MPWQLLADLVLAVHVGVVLFVVGGLAVVPVGHRFGWPWVTAPAFRLAHLAAIGVVVVQSWLGQVCPLTVLESWLRRQAGAAGYATSFIEHWLSRLIFYEAPFHAFVLAYTVFGVLVLAAWWCYPPRWQREA